MTFALTAAGPGPGAAQDPGKTAVATVFRIVSCESGIAVPQPVTNSRLVHECESLLAMRESLAGVGAFDWSAGKPMTEWRGVTVAGTHPRVRKLDLPHAGLSGELSGLVGELAQLTELRLEGNALTGMIPSKVARLEQLTDVYLAGNDFTLCVPELLGRVANTDAALLGLPECPPPGDLGRRWTGDLLEPGSYRYAPGPRTRPVVFDIPAGAGVEAGYLVIDGSTAGGYLMLRHRETGSRLCVDLASGARCPSTTVETPSVDANLQANRGVPVAGGGGPVGGRAVTRAVPAHVAARGPLAPSSRTPGAPARRQRHRRRVVPSLGRRRCACRTAVFPSASASPRSTRSHPLGGGHGTPHRPRFFLGASSRPRSDSSVPDAAVRLWHIGIEIAVGEGTAGSTCAGGLPAGASTVAGDARDAAIVSGVRFLLVDLPAARRFGDRALAVRRGARLAFVHAMASSDVRVVAGLVVWLAARLAGTRDPVALRGLVAVQI